MPATHLLAAVSLLVATAADVLAVPSSLDVFEARAYRVDRAGPTQSALSPVADNTWNFGEAIPYSARQSDLVLLAGDPLAVWFPSDGAASSLDGAVTYLDRMPQVDLVNGVVKMDRYHRLESHVLLPVVTGSTETGYWIGSLPTGEYEFVLNEWTLPGVESDPLGGLLGPPTLTTPWSLDIPHATLADSISWRFSVIPEPSTALLLLTGVAAAARRWG